MGRTQALVEPIVLDAGQRFDGPFAGRIGIGQVRTDGGGTIPHTTTDEFVADIVRALNVLAHSHDHLAGRTGPVHVLGKEFAVVINVVNVRPTKQGGAIIDGKRPTDDER
jgi:hypothetical protein